MAVVEVADLRQTFGRVVALDGISLSLDPGITALVGPNGAGKTTLMRMLAGTLKPSSGAVRLLGLDPYVKSQRQEALSNVAWMPQFASAPKRMPALDLVAYLCWMRGFNRVDAAAKAESALRSVGLVKSMHAKVGTLSGGMMRRVWLAQALAAEAPVLLLDEPSTGLDPRQRETMVRLLRETVSGTVLLSSHILEDAHELADRVIVLDKGQVTFDGPLTGEMNARWFLELTGDEEA